MKITTPVPGWSGVTAGVRFEDGTGETDNEAAIAYFQRQGYGVEGGNEDDGVVLEQPDDEAPVELIGTELADVDQGEYRDAADPRNDLVPVGGVKGDGTIVAGPNKGKRVSKKAAAPAPEAGSVAAPVQETGDPGQQSVNPSTPNPPEAVVPVAEPAPIDAAPTDDADAKTDSSGATQETGSTPATAPADSSKEG